MSFHLDLFLRFTLSCSVSAVEQFKFWTTKSISSGSVSSTKKNISGKIVNYVPNQIDILIIR